MDVGAVAGFAVAANHAKVSNAVAARLLKSEAAQAGQIVELLKAGSENLQKAAAAVSQPLDGTGQVVNRSV